MIRIERVAHATEFTFDGFNTEGVNDPEYSDGIDPSHSSQIKQQMPYSSSSSHTPQIQSPQSACFSFSSNPVSSSSFPFLTSGTGAKDYLDSKYHVHIHIYMCMSV